VLLTLRRRSRLLRRLRHWLAGLPLPEREVRGDLQDGAAAGRAARALGGCAYAVRGAVRGSRDRGRTTRCPPGRATKAQTSTGKAREAPIHAPGSGGRDRRTAAEYAADLASETDRSLARDPKRWIRRRTNEVPKDRSTEPEAPP